ncbi:MAG: hypothetical protein RI962_417 [Pseudomonadota bacterium]
MQTSASPTVPTATILRFPMWFVHLLTGQAAGVSSVEQRVDDIHSLQQMARDLELTQPNLAAELRNFATRA